MSSTCLSETMAIERVEHGAVGQSATLREARARKPERRRCLRILSFRAAQTGRNLGGGRAALDDRRVVSGLLISVAITITIGKVRRGIVRTICLCELTRRDTGIQNVQRTQAASIVIAVALP